MMSSAPVRFAMFLIVALCLSACVKTTTTPSGTQGAASTGGIEVFYSPPTDRPYTELGLVTTQTGQTVFHDRSAAGMIEKLKAEAAAIGADAIIVRSVEEGTWGVKGGGTTGFERGNSQAIAIKFK